MKFFRPLVSRAGFLSVGFVFALGISAAFAAWAPIQKAPLQPLYADDWNTIAHHTSSWERSGNSVAPGNDIFLNTSGAVGIGSNPVSEGLKVEINGRVGLTEVCNTDGGNCIPQQNIGAVVGVIPGGGLRIDGNRALGLTVTGCVNGQVLKFDGNNWVCGTDNSGQAGGTVSNVATGAGLTGGPIVDSGTIAVSAPTCDAASQKLVWNGSAFSCATDQSGASIWQQSGANINYPTGNVGIGNANPTVKLDVAGTVRATEFLYSSDATLKSNIATVTDAVEKLQAIRGVSFDWKADGKPSLGVIAQEIETVFPEAVTTDADTGLKSVDYSDLIAPLIEAIKEQQDEIDELRAQVQALSAQ